MIATLLSLFLGVTAYSATTLQCQSFTLTCNEVQPGPDFSNQELRFDGHPQRVEIPDSDDLTGTDKFSVGFWARGEWAHIQGTSGVGIITKSRETPLSQEWFISGGNSGYRNGLIAVFCKAINNCSGDLNRIEEDTRFSYGGSLQPGPDILNDGQKHHVVMSYNYVSGEPNAVVSYHIDGQPIASYTQRNGTVTSIANGAAKLVLGGFEGWGTNADFKGTLDDVWVAKELVNSNQADEMYNGGVPRDPRLTVNPTGCWFFEPDSDATTTGGMKDSCGENHGTAIGMSASNLQTIGGGS